MTVQIIFFEEDGKIYKAQINASLLNMSDKVSEHVIVKDIAHRGDNKYGILLSESTTKWNKDIEVERLTDAEF